MICSSVKRLRFIPWSSQWARAYFKMDYFNGARSLLKALQSSSTQVFYQFRSPVAVRMMTLRREFRDMSPILYGGIRCRELRQWAAKWK
ncbi:hypothetical protein EV128_103313 [Rhizobium azibense]|nr:hypothetical protein EV128_103313 [Rhizobium azibense]